jgi:hypothetical protein
LTALAEAAVVSANAEFIGRDPADLVNPVTAYYAGLAPADQTPILDALASLDSPAPVLASLSTADRLARLRDRLYAYGDTSVVADLSVNTDISVRLLYLSTEAEPGPQLIL